LSEQVIRERAAVEIKEDYCSRCSVCYSLCPFDAIKKEPETRKFILDIEKCQVCGICYSTCPAKAIDILYYDVDSLARYLEKAKKEYKSDTLVIMCRGSAPDFTGVQGLFGISKFIPLSVPCVGRIPEETLLRVITMGIEKIYVLACDEDYCRFDEGSAIAGRKIIALNVLLNQLGYGKEAITLKRNSLKVKVDSDLCIACGNCVYYCPYNAPRLESPGTVKIDLDACRGCGLCVAMCPALALDLENWERDRISALLSELLVEKKSPNILVFRCQWASFPPLNGGVAQSACFIDLPCASRVDMYHVLQAFQKGVDGVLIAACAEDDCKQEKASAKAKHSVAKLKERLSQIGLDKRLHFCTVAPRHPEGLEKELEQFSKALETAGAKEGKG
jgi:coenzyme F420-reducing hydrogenase delta subunit/ferredoxin